MGLRFIAVAVIAVFLHSTNPSFEEFKVYIRGSIQFDKERGAVFGALARSIVEDLLALSSSQADYIFFSIFSIDPKMLKFPEGGLRDRVRFFGIAGKFFLIADSSSTSSTYNAPGNPSMPTSVDTSPVPSPDKDCFRTGCSAADLDRALNARSESPSRPSWSGRSRENNCFRTGCSAAELEKALR
jgi:hypothetical protein